MEFGCQKKKWNKKTKKHFKIFIMKNYKKTLLFSLALILMALLPGCDLVADIFGAGVWVGILISVVVLVVLIIIVIKILKALRK